MTNKKQRTVIFGLIAALLIVTLTFTLVYALGGAMNDPERHAIAEEILHASYSDTSGTVEGGHLTQDEANTKEGKTVTWITNETNLLQFLSTATATDIGYLGNHVNIDWSNKTIKHSITTFLGKFDGNGYTVGIQAAAASGGSVQFWRADSADKLYSNAVCPSGDGTIDWQYIGFFVAMNKGTIRNTQFNFKTNNIKVNSEAGARDWEGQQIVAPEGGGIACAGVVTGANWGGTISNCKLNMQGNLVVRKTGVGGLGGNNVGFYMQSSCVGGFAAIMGNNALLEGCSLETGTSKIVAVSEGGYNGQNSVRRGLAIAGGIVGQLTSKAGDTTCIKQCSIFGNGLVAGMVLNAAKKEWYFGYAGGAVGVSINVANNTSIQMVDFQNGMIQGIMSDYTGQIVFNNLAAEPEKPNRMYAKLFGAVGGEGGTNVVDVQSKIQGTTFLFNFSAFCISKEQKDGGENFIDSRGRNLDVTKFATLAYPKNSNGSVKVEFLKGDATFNLKLTALADGFKIYETKVDPISGKETKTDVTTATLNAKYTSASTKFIMPNDQFGRFIWRASLVKGGIASSAHLDVADNAGAEIYQFKTSDYGSLEYTFGEIVDYKFINDTSDGSLQSTTRSKEYNGKPIILPKFEMISPLGTYTIDTTEHTQSGTTALPDSQTFKWKVTKEGKDSNVASTYLPGTYKISSTKKLGLSSFVYVDDAQKFILRNNSEKDYQFTVTVANLTATAHSSAWEKNASIKLTAGASALFDSFNYNIDGDITGDSDIKKAGTTTGGVTSYDFVDSVTSGKNGRTYNYFKAYITVGTTPVCIAQTNASVTVKVDNTAPVISNIQYWDYANGAKGALLSEAQMKEWRKTSVLVTYEATDDASGIGSRTTPPSLTITDTKPTEYKWTGEFVISKNDPINVKYDDKVGNGATQTFQALVDRIELTIQTGQQSYLLSNKADLGYDYSAQQGSFGYIPTYGGGGATFSILKTKTKIVNGAYPTDGWQKVASTADKDLTVSGVGATYIFNEDMEPTYVYVKIDSISGLYPTKYSPVGSVEYQTEANMTPWAFCFVVADLAMNESDILLNNGAITLITDKSKAFEKTYDNSLAYNSASNKLTIKAPTSGQITYRATYVSTRPAIGALEVIGVYSQVNAGVCTLTLTVQGVGADSSKYIVKFGAASNVVINTKINQATESVDVSSKIASTYVYGDPIPSAFEHTSAIDGKVHTFNIARGGDVVPNVGEYNVTATISAADPNIVFTCGAATQIKVTQKLVSVGPYVKNLDGTIDKDAAASVVYDGIPRAIGGSYLDNAGVVVECVTEHFSNPERTANKATGTIVNAGPYYIRFITGNKNYEAINKDEYTFTIQKGSLAIEDGIIAVDNYDSNVLSYPITFRKEQNGYDKAQIKVTYFAYKPGAVYTPSKEVGKIGTVTGEVSTKVLLPTEIKEVGVYGVAIEYLGSANYMNNDQYKLCTFVIQKADVIFNATNYSKVYTGEKFSYNLVDGKVEMHGKVKNNLITDADAPIVVRYRENILDKYADVVPDGFGCVSDAKAEYKYQLFFAGNSHYNTHSAEVILTITNAKFVGVTFDGVTADYELGRKQSVSANVPAGYLQGGTLKYTSGLAAQDTPFEFTNAGVYDIKATLSKPNYDDIVLTAKVTIKAIDLTGIVPKNISVIYDGKPHTAGLSGAGLVLDSEGNYTYKGAPCTVIGENVESTNVGKLEGTYKILVPNYNQLTVITMVIIDAVAAKEETFTLTEVDNTTNFKDGKLAKFVDINGNVVECGVKIYDKDGNPVELGEDGRLPNGIYRVVPDAGANYAVTGWNVTIAEPQTEGGKGKMSAKTMMIIGGAGGAGIIVIAVVAITLVAVRKKRSK